MANQQIYIMLIHLTNITGHGASFLLSSTKPHFHTPWPKPTKLNPIPYERETQKLSFFKASSRSINYTQRLRTLFALEIFPYTKFFRTQIFLALRFFSDTNFIGPKIFLKNKIFLGPKIFSDSKSFLE